MEAPGHGLLTMTTMSFPRSKITHTCISELSVLGCEANARDVKSSPFMAGQYIFF